MINCDFTTWPIIRMHFGSNPTYTDAITWLKHCDEILEKKQEFLIISTFEENYQFEHKARIKQAKWFKSVKPELKKWCIGMLRVTNDPIMVDKINSSAMKKGMPFKCTAMINLESAWTQANKILHYKESA
jgi:hypothetical protein